MPVVEVNGQELEFPDDMSQDQIKAVLQKKFPQTPKADEDYFSRVGADLRQRGANLANIQNEVDQDRRLGIEGAYEKVGQEAGAVGDIVGQGIVSAAKTAYNAIPQSITNPLKQSLQAVGQGARQTALGGALQGIAEEAPKVWGTYEQANPRTADLIKATANMASVVPIKPAATALSKASSAPVAATKQATQALVKQLRANPIKNSDEIKALASGYYKQAAEKGGVLKPEFTNSFIEKVQQLKPQTEIGKLVGGETAFTKVVDNLASIRDKPITLEAAQELDELLGDAIDNFTEMGRLKKEGKKLLDIQSEFRNMVENADESMLVGGKEGFQALKQGRKLWATSRKMADIEKIISRAEMMDNPATGIKTGFRTLYHNPARMKGYTSKERELVKKAADTGIISDTLRTILGSRLIPIITGAAGGGLGAAATAQAGSMAARGLATRAQLGKAKDITREISKGVQ